ncbi:unnamed protein product [Ilex paraguariensis]|uniref:Transposase n=1 Tax=Ilex paraguariensis TaxID=185542 RepID=A0ABC8RN73_9AQUA
MVVAQIQQWHVSCEEIQRGRGVDVNYRWIIGDASVDSRHGAVSMQCVDGGFMPDVIWIYTESEINLLDKTTVEEMLMKTFALKSWQVGVSGRFKTKEEEDNLDKSYFSKFQQLPWSCCTRLPSSFGL